MVYFGSIQRCSSTIYPPSGLHQHGFGLRIEAYWQGSFIALSVGIGGMHATRR